MLRRSVNPVQIGRLRVPFFGKIRKRILESDFAFFERNPKADRESKVFHTRGGYFGSSLNPDLKKAGIFDKRFSMQK